MIFTALRINLIFKIFLIIFDIIKSYKGHVTIQTSELIKSFDIYEAQTVLDMFNIQHKL